MGKEVQPECVSSLNVATLRLSLWSDGAFYIHRMAGPREGEGGEFSLDEFVKYVERFYEERL